MGLISMAINGGFLGMTNFGRLGLIVEDKRECIRIGGKNKWIDESAKNESQKNEGEDVEFDVHVGCEDGLRIDGVEFLCKVESVWGEKSKSGNQEHLTPQGVG